MKPFAEMSLAEQRVEYEKHCMKKAFHETTKPDEVDPPVDSKGRILPVNQKKKCILCQSYDREKRYCRLSSTLCINSSSRPYFTPALGNGLLVTIPEKSQVGIL